MAGGYSRRDFLKSSSVVGASIPLVGLGSQEVSSSTEKPVRLGFIGVGDRGSFDLDICLGMDGVQIIALCDINDSYLYRAKRWVEEAGQSSPSLYGKTRTDWQRMCDTEELDLVVNATPWEWHTPVNVAAMKTGKNVACEQPVGITVDECWELVDTSESTGKFCTVLKEIGDLTITNMIRQGLFGEIVHCEKGYQHDLRLVKFDPQREPWRLRHTETRNGMLYPSMYQFTTYLELGHGDRMETLVSMSSKSVAINEFARMYYGEKHPYAQKQMALGDYVGTLIRTAQGRVIAFNFDTCTPHPRGIFRLQGSKGVYMTDRATNENRIYIDGRSPDSHQWEAVDEYMKEYEHPYLKAYKPEPRKSIRGHGSGSTTPIMWHRMINAIRENRPIDRDVYDSVNFAVLPPISEASIANNNQLMEIPDFTRGKWKTRPPVEII